MNMKKTIAAVAACAVAVSAMATVVSAEDKTEQISLKYNLTTEIKLIEGADFTFMAKSVVGADGANPYVMDIYADDIDFAKQAVTVMVADKSTKTSYTYTFKTDAGAAEYDGYAVTDNTDLYGVKVKVGTGTNNAFSSAADLATTVGADFIKYVPVGDFDTTVGTMAADLAAADYKITATAGYQNHIRITIPKESTIYQSFIASAAGNDLDVTVKVAATAVGAKYNSQTVLNTALTKTAPDIGLAALDSATQTKVYQIGTLKEKTSRSPFETDYNISNALYGARDIINFLQTAGVNKDNSNAPYNNVRAVINDMIANYDDVVFKFNTATDKVAFSAQGNPYYDANGGTDCTKFPQHLYNLYGTENTKYTYSNDYAFNNLFSSALVANNGVTMNQSTTQPFVYDATSVMFSWLDMTEGDAQFVTTAAALNSLQLMTSSEWYWDSMEVIGYDLNDDDASTEAGADDEGKDLDEDDGEDDSTIGEDEDDGEDDSTIGDDEGDADEGDADEGTADEGTADEGDADEGTADEGTASENEGNPETGNAPIALAVIPVALAAAAVVAKKRG